MSEKYLLLYFDGPMQAWGYQSRFNRRTSFSMPTKSGIVGILAAALGVSRNDENRLEKIASLNIEVYTLKPPFRWTDYHTVGGGHTLEEKMYIPPKVNKNSPDTVLTYREYLSDAKFGALLSGKNLLLEECERALKNPVWGIWLGRKCCIPASPVCQGIFESKEDAFALLRERSNCHEIRKMIEVGSFEEGSDTLMDVPVNFATREYKPRRICDEPISEDKDADI